MKHFSTIALLAIGTSAVQLANNEAKSPFEESLKQRKASEVAAKIKYTDEFKAYSEKKRELESHAAIDWSSDAAVWFLNTYSNYE